MPRSLSHGIKILDPTRYGHIDESERQRGHVVDVNDQLGLLNKEQKFIAEPIVERGCAPGLLGRVLINRPCPLYPSKQMRERAPTEVRFGPRSDIGLRQNAVPVAELRRITIRVCRYSSGVLTWPCQSSLLWDWR